MRTWMILSGAVALWATTAFGGPSGTTLTGSKTASATVTQTYTWTVSKTPPNQSVKIPIGSTVPVSFTVTVTRSSSTVSNPTSVSGTITLNNVGTAPTIDLYLTDQIEELVGSNWVVVAGPIVVPTGGELAASSSKNYPYSLSNVTLDPSQHYRNHAIATIDNFSGFEGTAHSIDIIADPIQLTVVTKDTSANLSDAFTCPTGFTCTPSGFSQVVTGTTTVNYTVNIKNISQCCGQSFTAVNTATVDPSDTHVTVPPATANVSISTGKCPANFCFTQGPGIDLEPAAPYTLFGLVNSSLDISKATVTGNLGLAQGGTATTGLPTSFTGAAYINTGATLSGNGTFAGGIFTGQDLSAAVTAAVNTSTYAAGLTPTATYTTWNSTLTIAGNGGQNVIDVGSVNLGSSQTVTLTGGPLDYFIINVSGGFTLTGTSAILAGSGIQPYQILINITGSTPDIATDARTTTNGIILAPNRSGVPEGTHIGNLILGGSSETIGSSTIVTAVCTGTPPCSPVDPLACQRRTLEDELGVPLE